jgi:hypothetical protein
MQREGAMITLRIEQGLFSALRAGFEAKAYDKDAPIKSKLIGPCGWRWPTRLPRHRARG